MAVFLWSLTDRGLQEVGSSDARTLRIGRATNAELRFTDSMVDLEHATIRLEGIDFWLRDAGSTSGSWVDGARISERRLRHDDVIELGGFVLRVELLASGDSLFLAISRAGDLLSSGSFHTFKASSSALTALAEREAEKLGVRRGGDISSYIARVIPEPEPPPFQEGALPLPRRERMDALGWTDVFPTMNAPIAPPPPAGSDTFDPYARTTVIKAVRQDAPPPGLSSGPNQQILAPGGGAFSPIVPPTATAPPAPKPAPPPELPSATMRSSPQLATAAGPEAQAKAPRPPAAAGIDYARAYRLPAAGLKAAITVLGALAIFGFFQQSHARRGGEIFSPGRLADAHRSATCDSCHSGFTPVAEASCRTCHSQVGDHQSLIAQTSSINGCRDCHLEHRGADKLRQASAFGCVDCHGDLQSRVPPGATLIGDVRDFVSGHPEFAVDTAAGRRRLSEPIARQADRSGLLRFNHEWHFAKAPANIRRDCASCHRRDTDDEIAPLDFQKSCQGCHSLAFDPRFPGQQAVHGTPRAVFDNLIGTYVRNEAILGRLTEGERGVVNSTSLSNERKLTKVAQLVGERMLRTTCAKCHRMERPVGAGPEATVVTPVAETPLRFQRARFRHAPHLQISACVDCHREAPASRAAEDLLVPGIEACRTCHRPPEGAKVPAAQLGGFACLDCHSFHPTVTASR